MKDEKVIEQRIIDHATWLQAILDLQWMTINHKFNTVIDEDGSAGKTNVDWEYRQAAIQWSLPTVAILEDDELDAHIVHEFAHVLIGCLWAEIPEKFEDKLKKLNELATENVTRAIVAALNSKPL